MNNLRKLREEKKLSLRELGKELNMNASVLGNYERGDRNPKKEVWEKLAIYFDVSVPYIMGLSDTRNEKTMQNVLNQLNLLLHNDSSFNITPEMESMKYSYLANNIQNSLAVIISYILLESDQSDIVGNSTFNFVRHLAKAIEEKDTKKIDFINSVTNNLFETRGLASNHFLEIPITEIDHYKEKDFSKKASREDIIELFSRFNQKNSELNEIQYSYFKTLLGSLTEEEYS